MRSILPVGALLALALTCGCQQSYDIDTLRRFEEADDIFRSATVPEEYLRAAAVYESLAEDGVESGALYYNLGNAYLRAGQKGRAIASYRLAQRAMPAEPRLQANLDFALGDAAVEEKTRSVVDHVFFWRGWMGYRSKWYLASGLATAIFVLSMIGRFAKGKRTWTRPATWVVTGVSVVYAASLALDFHDVQRVRHGVVVEDGVQARKGDAESFEPAFTEPLDDGVEFVVLEERNDWLHVELPKGLTGWIPSRTATTY